MIQAKVLFQLSIWMGLISLRMLYKKILMKTGRINLMKECNKEIGEFSERIIRYIFEVEKRLIL
jgi:hypothetical protein